jgi:cytochrome P450
MTFAYFEMRIVLAEILTSVRLERAPGPQVTPLFRGVTVAPSEALRLVVAERLPTR